MVSYFSRQDGKCVFLQRLTNQLCSIAYIIIGLNCLSMHPSLFRLVLSQPHSGCYFCQRVAFRKKKIDCILVCFRIPYAIQNAKAANTEVFFYLAKLEEVDFQQDCITWFRVVTCWFPGWSYLKVNKTDLLQPSLGLDSYAPDFENLMPRCILWMREFTIVRELVGCGCRWFHYVRCMS